MAIVPKDTPPIQALGMFMPRLRDGRTRLGRERRIARHAAIELYRKRMDIAQDIVPLLQDGVEVEAACHRALVMNKLSVYTFYGYPGWLVDLIDKSGGINPFTTRVAKHIGELKEKRKEWLRQLVILVAFFFISMVSTIVVNRHLDSVVTNAIACAVFFAPTLWCSILAESQWRAYKKLFVAHCGDKPNFDEFVHVEDIVLGGYTPSWEREYQEL